jgi:hypothetical protein
MPQFFGTERTKKMSIRDLLALFQKDIDEQRMVPYDPETPKWVRDRIQEGASVIFLTARQHSMSEASATDIHRFGMKPVSQAKVRHALNRLLHDDSRVKNSVFVNHDSHLVLTANQFPKAHVIQILQSTNYWDRIYYVDDNPDELLKVHQTCPDVVLVQIVQ